MHFKINFRINRLSFLLLLLALHAGLLASSTNHPCLILTPDKIETLKISKNTTHAKLWERTVQQADDFLLMQIPVMKNAHNSYRKFGDSMPVLGLAYLLTGEQKYLEAAGKWIEEMLMVQTWSGSQNLGRSAWITGCVLLYDWLYPYLDDELKGRLKTRLISEASIIMKQASRFRVLSNHLLIETTALGLIALLFRDDADISKSILIQADQWAEDIIRYAPRDGSWGEGIQYWQYGLGYFLRYLEACRSAGYKDYYQKYNWLQQTGFFPIHFSLPGRPRESVNFSDSRIENPALPFLFYLPAQIYRNGYFQDFGNRILANEISKFCWLDFLFYDHRVEVQNIHTLPTLKHFPDNGFVIMRSDWQEHASIIGFRCGPAPGHTNQDNPDRVKLKGFGPGHGHPDINSFCLFAGGEWLAIDPGYTRLKETRNHNTLIINGHGQAGEGEKWLDYMTFESRHPAPAILMVESNPLYDQVLGDAGNIYIDKARLKRFRRHLLFLKPEILVIADDVEMEDNSSAEWLLNVDGLISESGLNNYELRKNKIRLHIRPVLPERIQTETIGRTIDIAGKRDEQDKNAGKIVTLNLQVKSIERTFFLVILTILKDLKDALPTVSLNDNLLQIIHNKQRWEIQVLNKSENMWRNNALLKVIDPAFTETPDYIFRREKHYRK